jgi:hypothetical protein
MGNIGGKYRPLRELVLAHDSHIVQTSAFLDRSGLMENHRGGKTGGPRVNCHHTISGVSLARQKSFGRLAQW